MECGRCGGDKWLITSAGILDDIRNALGHVLYKCVRCGRRRRQRAWPVSHCIVAHCPRCYSQRFQVWNRAFLRPSFLHSLIFTMGGDAYRCYDCQHVFVSLRPRRLFQSLNRASKVAPAPANAVPANAADSEPRIDSPVNG